VTISGFRVQGLGSMKVRARSHCGGARMDAGNDARQTASLGIQPRVKSLESSYTGQPRVKSLRSSFTGLYPQNGVVCPERKGAARFMSVHGTSLTFGNCCLARRIGFQQYLPGLWRECKQQRDSSVSTDACEWCVCPR